MPKTSPKTRNKPKPSIHQQRMGKWAMVLLIIAILVFTVAFYIIARMSNRVGGSLH